MRIKWSPKLLLEIPKRNSPPPRHPQTNVGKRYTTLVANEIIQAVAKKNDCITKFDKKSHKRTHAHFLTRYGTLGALPARHTFTLSDTVAMVTKLSHLHLTKVLLLRCKQEL